MLGELYERRNTREQNLCVPLVIHTAWYGSVHDGSESVGEWCEVALNAVVQVLGIGLVHNLLALLIGFSTASAFRLPYKDRRTLTIETGIQNSGLGLMLLLGTDIFADFPPHGGMLVITAWWGVWHIVSGLTVSAIFNLTKKKNS